MALLKACPTTAPVCTGVRATRRRICISLVGCWSGDDERRVGSLKIPRGDIDGVVEVK